MNLKIAIIGYGKMGKTIDRLLRDSEDQVILRIDQENRNEVSLAELSQADVAIEFSRPESAVANIRWCLEAGVPLVSGTTGWLEHYDEMTQAIKDQKGAFLYASNFSIGVNLFFAVNRYLAQLMASQSSYKPSLEEIHHTEKLDAPSGTGITLAQQMLEVLPHKSTWVNRLSEQPDELSIISKRIDKVPGTHTILYQSAVDEIEIKHTAHSREGFARGAIQAARWIVGKEGVFSMSDVLGI